MCSIIDKIPDSWKVLHSERFYLALPWATGSRGDRLSMDGGYFTEEDMTLEDILALSAAVGVLCSYLPMGSVLIVCASHMFRSNIGKHPETRIIVEMEVHALVETVLLLVVVGHWIMPRWM